jgi:CheY-like chemotaxis protein
MRRVLIADDQRTIRMLVSATLAVARLDVIEASDGDEAWGLIRERCPDLAILDVQMPGRTGLELVRAIRQDGQLADMRIILLTATAQGPDVDAGRSLGADRYVTKPFSPLDLLEEVRQVLELR